MPLPADKNAGQTAGLDRLLEDLASLDTTAPVSDEEDLLPFIVEQAARGVDIARRYPSFYRRLLSNTGLQQAFVEALDMLESGRAARLQAGWTTPPGWRLSWERSIAQLQAALSGLAPNPVYRLDDDAAEDLSWTLLRDQAEIAGVTVDILLQAIQSIEAPQFLRPTALVALHPGPAGAGLQQPDLQARIEWGGYSGSAVIDAQGRAVFPPLEWRLVLDEDGQTVISGLYLSLQKLKP